MKDQEKKNNLPIIKKNPLPFTRVVRANTLNTTNQNTKVYLLISKNLKLPFAESNILAIGTDIDKIFEYANKELQRLQSIGYNEKHKRFRKRIKTQMES